MAESLNGKRKGPQWWIPRDELLPATNVTADTRGWSDDEICRALDANVAMELTPHRGLRSPSLTYRGHHCGRFAPKVISWLLRLLL